MEWEEEYESPSSDISPIDRGGEELVDISPIDRGRDGVDCISESMDGDGCSADVESMDGEDCIVELIMDCAVEFMIVASILTAVGNGSESIDSDDNIADAYGSESIDNDGSIADVEFIDVVECIVESMIVGESIVVVVAKVDQSNPSLLPQRCCLLVCSPSSNRDV